MGKKSIDLIGMKFGKLTVLEKLGLKSNQLQWLCMCECGNKHITAGSALRLGRTKSCGCSKERKREEKCLVGKVFGKLTVIEELERGRYRKYLCVCECGNSKKVEHQKLKSSQVKSCGCLLKGKNITGMTVGNLTVIKEVENKKWLCKCKCGNFTEVSKCSLTNINGKSRTTKSCGCLIGKNNPRILDLVGEKFGRLTAVKMIGSKKNAKLWLCLCDCGNEVEVTSRELKNEDKKSCGCLASTQERSKRITGENNPMFGRIGALSPVYNEHLTEEERVKGRKYTEYYTWRKDVYERDGYKCIVCETLGDGSNLVAHHLDGYHWAIEKRTEVDNGVTLCSDCHDDFHSKYGKKNNTKRQFEKWVKLNELDNHSSGTKATTAMVEQEDAI